jgi:hypothetical protein
MLSVLSRIASPTSGQLAREPGGGTSAAGRGVALLPNSGAPVGYPSPPSRNDCTGGLEIGGGGADAGIEASGIDTEVTSGGAVGTGPGAIVYGRVTG